MEINIMVKIFASLLVEKKRPRILNEKSQTVKTTLIFYRGLNTGCAKSFGKFVSVVNFQSEFCFAALREFILYIFRDAKNRLVYAW